MSGGLSNQVKVRVDDATKAQVAVEMRKQQRSEGAIVRLALCEYLSKRKGQRV